MPTTSRRTTRLGVLLAVVVAALTLGFSNAAWAQEAVSLPDVADNALAASSVNIPILNDINVCGVYVDVVAVDVSGAIGAYDPASFCVISD
jgi:hypothetical protein